MLLTYFPCNAFRNVCARAKFIYKAKTIIFTYNVSFRKLYVKCISFETIQMIEFLCEKLNIHTLYNPGNMAQEFLPSDRKSLDYKGDLCLWITLVE